MKTFLTLSLQLLITSFLFAQAPQGIPYQAVMRNADGTVMASSAVNLTFMIHNASATGSVVYQESHALTSNLQGLVSCVVGNGVVSQGNFATINWGGGAKFLHVMMGTTDMGTQQMLSVPYALYSNGVGVRVSETGDTLTIGGNSVIVPGISAANANNNNIPTSGLGAVVLPGNNTCADQFINVLGCNGQTSLTYDGRTYDLVEIGGQCWFADNLATDQYRNGDPIPTGLDNTTWQNTTAGAYAIYNNDPANDVIYGKLYNWFTVADDRGVCPAGWHVPSDCEWMYLEGSLGMSIQEMLLSNVWRGVDQGGALKATSSWLLPNVGATNSSGFSFFAGGYRNYLGNYNFVNNYGYLWSITEEDVIPAWGRLLFYNSQKINRTNSNKQSGFSIRCLKDSETFPIQGCTDGSACNFMANATQDDGSCLYPNATCNDGNANTMNDAIDGNCTCSGVLMVNGCTNAQACNYNPSANVDNGSCLLQGVSCDDGDANTVNDIINVDCICSGSTLINGIYALGNGLTDINGTYYSSIIINGQEWMRKNLAVTKYRNGDPIQTGLSNATWQSTTSGAYSIYNNDAANNTTYGKLYNWYAVNDSRGLCPTGWHVPSDEEWTNLINYLDPNQNLIYVTQSSIAGGKLKSISGWMTPNLGATNVSGFSALPGGYRATSGSFGSLTNLGYWWNSTDSVNGGSFMRKLRYDNSNIDRASASKQTGFSVRCLKD